MFRNDFLQSTCRWYEKKNAVIFNHEIINVFLYRFWIINILSYITWTNTEKPGHMINELRVQLAHLSIVSCLCILFLASCCIQRVGTDTLERMLSETNHWIYSLTNEMNTQKKLLLFRCYPDIYVTALTWSNPSDVITIKHESTTSAFYNYRYIKSEAITELN